MMESIIARSFTVSISIALERSPLTSHSHTYILKAVFAELRHEVKEPESGEPRHPKDDFVKILNVHDAEDEDELVENKVPELVFHVLSKRLESKSKFSGSISKLFWRRLTCCSDILNSPKTIF